MQETAQNIVHNIIPFIKQPNWATGQKHESAVLNPFKNYFVFKSLNSFAPELLHPYMLSHALTSANQVLL